MRFMPASNASRSPAFLPAQFLYLCPEVVHHLAQGVGGCGLERVALFLERVDRQRLDQVGKLFLDRPQLRRKLDVLPGQAIAFLSQSDVQKGER